MERKQPLRVVHIDPAVRAATLKRLAELAKTAKRPAQATRDAAMSARDRAEHEAQQRRATRDAEMKRTSDQLKNINANNKAYWSGRKTRDNPLAGLALGLGAAGAAAGAAAASFMGSLVNEGVRSVTTENAGQGGTTAGEGTVDGLTNNVTIGTERRSADPLTAFGDLVRQGATGMNFGTVADPIPPGPGHHRPTNEQLNWFNERYHKLNGAERDAFTSRWRRWIASGDWE